MLKRLLLACVLAMLCVLPVGANIPENPKCDNETLNVFSGNIELRAKWLAKTYNCGAGKYLDALAGDCLDCPGNGYYCPGTGEVEYNNEDEGKGYCGSEWESPETASDSSQCYKMVEKKCSEYNKYTYGFGTANYINGDESTIVCKQSYGSTECIAEEPENCRIVSLNCIANYEQTSTEDGGLQCVPATKTCSPGKYLPIGASECAICPEDSFCPGMTYTLNTYTEGQEVQGVESCDGLRSPKGSRSEKDCGRILHVGSGEKDIIHMHRDKVEGRHYLVVKVGDTLYYADAAPVVEDKDPITINPESNKTFRTRIGEDETEYYIYERRYE